MTRFIDHCTSGDCGEPATSWLASRVGEAFCHRHHPTPAPTTPVDGWVSCPGDPVDGWVSCPGCAFQCREGEWRRLVDHVWGHARHAKDDADLVERQRRAQVCRFVELVDGLQAVVTHARGEAS